MVSQVIIKTDLVNQNQALDKNKYCGRSTLKIPFNVLSSFDESECCFHDVL